jgi:hypothetical protein
MTAVASPGLLALSDLHVAYPENRKIVEGLRVPLSSRGEVTTRRPAG